MFLQETKTKRGGKTYISYLVRESFRTSNGPARPARSANLTHLPKEVRDLVGQALKGATLVPLGRLEVANIHNFGGAAVLEDAARRHGLGELLAPLGERHGALVQGAYLRQPALPALGDAVPGGGEDDAAGGFLRDWTRTNEKFEDVDLEAALRVLDQQWGDICELLLRRSARGCPGGHDF